jgi:heme/copper-type cytochrome/quinol oxidase subunit 2
VPGYYQCPELCGLVMQGVLEALAKSGLPPRAWRIVGFSIDPQDTPATRVRARHDYRAYARFVAPEATPPVDLDLLTSDAATSAALAQALGYAVQSAQAPARRSRTARASSSPRRRAHRALLSGRALRRARAALAVTDAAGGARRLAQRPAHAAVRPLRPGHRPLQPGRHGLAARARLRRRARAGRVGVAPSPWAHTRPAPRLPCEPGTRPGACHEPEPATLVPRAFTLFPNAASSIAPHTDALFGAMLLLCGGMALLIAVLIAWFCVRYRRGAAVDRSDPPSNARGLEIAWTLIPMLISAASTPGPRTTTSRCTAARRRAARLRGGQAVDVEGQHRNGRREIGELHLPLGRPVRLVMTSEDVIHSFYVPAFRIKQDVVPGRYTRSRFTPSRPASTTCSAPNTAAPSTR